MSRVALVTGTSSGIGRATADLLADRGWTVIGASRRGTGGGAWQGFSLNVNDNQQVDEVVNHILTAYGHLDALVTAAGHGLAGPVETTTIDEAMEQLETNFWGTVRVVRAALPAMRNAGKGRIILLSSIGGEIALPFQAYYSASKFAIEGWAEALAYEVAPFGLHVTLVQPGNFATGFTDSRRTPSAGFGAYDVAARAALTVMERDERSGDDASKAARVIVEQLEASRPRRRVSVGRASERIGLVAKRLLPHAWFERAASGSLGV